MFAFHWAVVKKVYSFSNVRFIRTSERKSQSIFLCCSSTKPSTPIKFRADITRYTYLNICQTLDTACQVEDDLLSLNIIPSGQTKDSASAQPEASAPTSILDLVEDAVFGSVSA